MKKSFYFALALTAGLFASCSSDEIAQAPQGGLDANDAKGDVIQLSVANAAQGVTRGTGTVGNTTANTDQWDGQKINVSMFKKGTLTVATEDPDDNTTPTIYDASELTVEKGGAAAVLLDIAVNGDVDVLRDRTVESRYFPGSGSYDFWGYRLDDAAASPLTPADITYDTTDPAASTAKVDIAIDGSQDIMVGKAELAAAQIDANDKVIPGAGSAYTEHFSQDKVFSAYSARRNVNPQISFKHLLSRFTFEVKGANAASCVDAAVTDAAVIAKTGVKVDAIKVKSKTTGKVVVAYTATTEPKRIEWDYVDANDYATNKTAGYADELSLKQRALSVKTPQTGVFTTFVINRGADVGGNPTYTYTWDGHPGAQNVQEADASLTAITTALPLYSSNTPDAQTGLPDETALTDVATVAAAIATENTSSATYYYYSMATPIEYKTGSEDVTAKLVALQPVTPTYVPAVAPADPTFNKVGVGEALLLPADVNGYDVELTLRQYVVNSTTNVVDANGHQVYLDAATAATATNYYVFMAAAPADKDATVVYPSAAAYDAARGTATSNVVTDQAAAEADAATKAAGTYYYTDGTANWWSIKVNAAAVAADGYQEYVKATKAATANFIAEATFTAAIGTTYYVWETTTGAFKTQKINHRVKLSNDPITNQPANFEAGKSYNVVLTISGSEVISNTQPSADNWDKQPDINLGDDDEI